MILRRFMEHVKDQNWLAVGLDFLVVVSGIFLGMQVSEWNDSRKDRELERIYLERLAEDLQEDLRVFTRIYDESLQKREYIIYIDGLISGDDTDTLDPVKFMKATDNFGWIRSMGPGKTTWDELVSTGRIELITNHTIKADIAEYYEHFDRYHSHTHTFNDIQLRFTRMKERWFSVDQVLRHINEGFEGFTEQEARGILETMRQDDELKNIMSSLATVVEVFGNSALNDQERIKKILKELDREGVKGAKLASTT
ncbi:DUF6090 family protein [Kangiella sediminilitoris]|uniref:Uncharacterized protein n=1 Tax=Kangiella sediminilitoris TaxID=1144748 RepID=A0A1B3B7L5_9GAMM|nr:DUF6090 family protein [Kangiella sediminilitoris]AOE48774.1 hypothetical protein KS2013_42 [Kangiella sediminilitoris]